VEDAAWRNVPEVVRRFLAARPLYDELCNEVAYILRKRLRGTGVEIATVSSRAKRLGSFLQKSEQKRYRDPFTEVTDFAGARVVCLYKSSLEKVRRTIRREFDVIEEVNKFDQLGTDRFGYGAWHFIVRLGSRSAGARYDELKDLVCEIQVRTVVQDAWAIIQHHLVYKKESEVPSQIQRALNALAAQFEGVDDQFDSLREKREKYKAQVRHSGRNGAKASRIALNLDSFTEYLGHWFPGRQREGYDGQLRLVFDKLFVAGVRDVGEVDKAIRSSQSARTKMFSEFGLSDIRKTTDGRVPASLEALFAVALETSTDLAVFRFNDRWRAAVGRYRQGGVAG
jgi:ppGpp synthetase/RelA/SpoT-type nucleotidyltranferase